VCDRLLEGAVQRKEWKLGKHLREGGREGERTLQQERGEKLP
jgi:hypothetical protein